MKRLNSLLAFTALCLPAALQAAPDMPDAATDTPEVLVEGVRDRDAQAGLPAVQATVTREQLTETTNLYDVEDALKYLPGIDVRKRYVGDRSSPVGSRVSGGIGLSARGLVYADGLLLANLLGNDNNDYTPRWGMVAPEEVERIDVLYGPYSALYPGNAMGAVVKMVTRMPERLEVHAKAQYFSQQFNAYASNDRYDGHQLSAMLGDRFGAFSGWLSLNHLQSLGQPIAFAPITSTPTTGAATITGAIGETDQFGVQRYIVGGTSIDDTRRRQNASTGTAGTLSNLDGTAWRTADAIATWHPSPEGTGHALTIGLHHDNYLLDTLVQNVSDWRSSASGTRASAFGGRTRTSALFVQDAWDFAPGLQTTLGLRVEQWAADRGRVSNSTATQTFRARNENFVSPKVSLQWRTHSAWTLRASTALAYRLPTVAELFQGTIPNAQNTVTYNNPNLEPERVLATEINAERPFGMGETTGWFRATVFHELNRNALLRQPIPPTDPNYTATTGTATFWSNVDEVRSRGAEVAWHAADVATRGFDVDGSLTFAHSLVTHDSAQPAIEGSWQNRVPKWRARLVGSYRASETWSVSLAGRYSGLQRNGYPNVDVRPNTYLGFAPYLVFDTRATWKPLKHVTVAAGIDNLTNRLYYQFHPYPRRTFNVELRYDQ